MTKKIDLSDMLSPTSRPRAKVVSLDDLRTRTAPSEEAQEVVVFWTDWTCQCGSHYEAPTYGDTFTRYQRFANGNPSGSVYKHYLPANHCELPRRVDIKHINLRHCPQCIHEDQVEADRQGELFHAS